MPSPALTVSRRAINRRRRPHGVILSYHRVATASWDPWDICVAPQRFEQQLAKLSRRAEIVPLSALASRLRAGRARPVVAVTFDDGYADNLYAALPLLEKYDVPATVFIATGWIDRGEPYWWDRLSAMVTAMDPLPASIRLPVGDEEFRWRPKGKHRRDRDRFHLALWSSLVVATHDARKVALNELQNYANYEAEVDESARPMTSEELRQLADSPLIEIGAHTMNHPSLPDLPADAQVDEVVGSREQCREVTGQLPSSFAYPYGRLNAETPDVVRSAGFDRACSTQPELVWADTDDMLLPRIQVPDCSIGKVLRGSGL